MECKKFSIPVWLFAALVTSLAIAVVTITGSVLLVDSSRDAMHQMAGRTSGLVLSEVRRTIGGLLNETEFAAGSVLKNEPLIETESIPADTIVTPYNPSVLLRQMITMDELPQQGMVTLGFAMRHPTTGSKTVYEISRGFLPQCPDFAYGYMDLSTNFRYYAKCLSATQQIDMAQLANQPVVYNGSDTGFSALEVKLLDGEANSTFLPIRPLLGVFTLVWDTPKPSTTSPGNAYCFSFATKSLQGLDQYLQQNVKIGETGSSGLVYVVESDTFNLVSASSSAVTTYIPPPPGSWGSGERIDARQSTNSMVAGSASELQRLLQQAVTDDQIVEGRHGNNYVWAQRMRQPGTDLFVVAVVPVDDYTRDLKENEKHAVMVMAIVAVVCVVVTSLLWYFSLSRRLAKMAELYAPLAQEQAVNSGAASSFFSELQGFQQQANAPTMEMNNGV